MSFFKQAIGVVTGPLVIASLLAFAAVASRLAGRQRVSRALLLCAAGIAYLGSIPLAGEILLRPLEASFSPLASPAPAVNFVVVLGSGYAPRAGIPVTGALDAEGLARITEGVRLLRSLPGARLVVSGGAPPGRVPPAQGYALLARSLGVAPDSIIVCDQPPETAAEALAVKALLGGAPFLLVTSAYHMPRAVLLMRRAGADPIPAPTGQRVQSETIRRWRVLLPGAEGLRDTELAIHEYFGIAAIKAGLE
jgi:uncharacterized SAM-binding protein YcdF (DUF218 family)